MSGPHCVPFVKQAWRCCFSILVWVGTNIQSDCWLLQEICNYARAGSNLRAVSWGLKYRWFLFFTKLDHYFQNEHHAALKNSWNYRLRPWTHEESVYWGSKSREKEDLFSHKLKYNHAPLCNQWNRPPWKLLSYFTEAELLQLKLHFFIMKFGPVMKTSFGKCKQCNQTDGCTAQRNVLRVFWCRITRWRSAVQLISVCLGSSTWRSARPSVLHRLCFTETVKGTKHVKVPEELLRHRWGINCLSVAVVKN